MLIARELWLRLRSNKTYIFTLKPILLMKKFFALALGLMAVSGVMASDVDAKPKKQEQQPEGIQFTVVKENPITSIKNQNRAGTCWCYSS